MALDSDIKRSSASGCGRPHLRGGTPLSTKDWRWRAAAGNSYAGNGFARPGVSAVDLSQVLLFPAGSAPDATYVLQDEFTTTEGAPLASPRASESVGSLVLTQADGQFSIAGSKLVFPGQTTPAANDLGFIGTSAARISGRQLRALVNLDANNATGPHIGCNPSNVLARANQSGHSWLTESDGTIQADDGATGREIGTYSASTDYQVAVVYRAAGNFILVKGGAYTNWTLLWVTEDETDAELHPAANFWDNSGTIDYFRFVNEPLWTPVPILSDSFNRGDSTTLGTTDGSGVEESGGSGLTWTELHGDLEITSNKVGTVSQGADNFAAAYVDCGSANVVIQATVSVHASGAASILGRVTDKDNHWIVELSDASDALTIWKREGGTYAAQATTAFAVTPATDYELLAVFDGSTITAYVDQGNRIQATSATLNQTNTNFGVYHGGGVGPLTDRIAAWRRSEPAVPNV